MSIQEVDSFVDYISKADAAGEHLCMPDDMSFVDGYDVVRRGSKAMEKADISPWQAYENHDIDELNNIMLGHQQHIEKLLINHGECIKRGAIISAIHGNFDLDVNQWSIDTLATIGFNTQREFDIDNEKVSFNLDSGKWISVSGKEYMYDLGTGNPVVE